MTNEIPNSASLSLPSTNSKTIINKWIYMIKWKGPRIVYPEEWPTGFSEHYLDGLLF